MITQAMGTEVAKSLGLNVAESCICCHMLESCVKAARRLLRSLHGHSGSELRLCGDALQDVNLSDNPLGMKLPADLGGNDRVILSRADHLVRARRYDRLGAAARLAAHRRVPDRRAVHLVGRVKS